MRAPPTTGQAPEGPTTDLAPVGAPFPPPSGPAALGLVVGVALLARSELDHGFLAAVVDGFDLVVHEAGHPLLALTGSRVLAILGGTLAQLAVPVAAAAAFWRRRQPASLAAALAWLGLNLVNVGRYVADAEARALPLLGADADGHDWWNLLGMVGARHHGPALGAAVAGLGWLLQGLAPAWVVAAWLRVRLDAARRG